MVESSLKDAMPPHSGTSVSTTKCAIVPLYPKELTPAAARPSCCSCETSCVGRCITCLSTTAACTCGLSFCSCALGGICSCCSKEHVLKSPLSPAAASEWPRLAFDPTNASCIESSREQYVERESDRASSGSPSAVPVPCASTHTDRLGWQAASASAALRSACCATPFGAVRLALLPS